MLHFSVRILIGLLCLTGLPISNYAQQLLLKNATIIEGPAKKKPWKGSILIKNGRIAKVYNHRQPLPRPNSTLRILDLTGMYITPGIMDAHVHLATLVDPNWNKARLATDSILNNMLLHGVTTVRDMTGDGAYLASVKKDILAGKTPGPDIFYAAQFAGPGYFAAIDPSGERKDELGHRPWFRAIADTSNIPQAIRQAKAAGVTGIKIYSDLSATLIRQITKAAHRQGLLAWSHAEVFPSKPMDTIKAGVNSLSHGFDMVFQQLPGDTLNINQAWQAIYAKDFRFDSSIQSRLIQQMRQHNVFLDPTVYLGEQNHMNSGVIITAMAHRAGVPIVTGTDWVYPSQGAIPLLEECLLLKNKCGLNNADILQAATVNSAAVLGLKDRGAIKAGMRADLLVLSANPLQDIRHLFAPKMVFKGGKLVVDLDPMASAPANK